MLGLIKKDILVIKNNFKAIIVFLAVYLLVSSDSSANASFILPFMTIMLMITTFSYDEFNNWYAYAITMPTGRKDIVKSKYVVTGLLTIFSAILSVCFALIMQSFNGPIDIMQTLEELLGVIFACVLMISIMFPFLFKFGVEKGRLLIFAGTFILVGAIMFLSKTVNFGIPSSIITFLDNYGLILIIAFSILIIYVSYKISQRIFAKKEL